jgi:hypothetical protein
MHIKEIQDFAEIRVKARAYMCYLLSRHIRQTFNVTNHHEFQDKLKHILNTIPNAEVVYVLDSNGKQIVGNVSKHKALSGIGGGQDRSNRAYFYRVEGEHRCILTDPYPSMETNRMVVTSSFPIYDTNNTLLYIVCVDITLENMLKIVHPSSVDSISGAISRFTYTAFSIALSAVALLLFVKGITLFLQFGLDFQAIDINQVFKATILLTLSLAIFDLVKAIFEEEVLGKVKQSRSDDSHRTMVRFLGSIIIALSIEALMLVFKFALTDPSKLEFAVYLIGGVSLLLVSLSLYMYFSNHRNTKVVKGKKA